MSLTDGNDEACTVVANVELTLTATSFETESCCDKITITPLPGADSTGIPYSGGLDDGPVNVSMAIGGTVSWSSDSSAVDPGFVLCATAGAVWYPPPASPPAPCAPGCPPSYISDGACDSACNNLVCGYDGTDCRASPPPPYSAPPCAPGCPPSWINDGTCDSSCNNVVCRYDGTDCNYSPSGGGDDDSGAGTDQVLNMFIELIKAFLPLLFSPKGLCGGPCQNTLKQILHLSTKMETIMVTSFLQQVPPKSRTGGFTPRQLGGVRLRELWAVCHRLDACAVPALRASCFRSCVCTIVLGARG